ncbi:MAG: sulfatase-like hydrolase/transferase [Planctomycetota bacterium]|nr:sulfatase-like hydrolase/transferase [Planctomycetota bacterium]
MATTARPNVLWLMTDEQRPDSLGCYGTPFARTPHLDVLAASGTLCRTALTPAPVCVAARAALLTGLRPFATGVSHNRSKFASKPRFLTECFAEAGYATASFGKQHYNCPFGRAFAEERLLVLGEAVDYFGYKKGYRHEEFGVVQYPGGPDSRWVLAGRYPEDAATTPEHGNVDHALAWHERHARERPETPWLLRVSFNAPHTPVTAPAPYDGCIDPEAVDAWFARATNPLAGDRPRYETEHLRGDYAGSQRLDAAQLHALRRCYYGCVSFLDAQFGRLLEALRARGALENTLIVYLSDHGAGLGENGLLQKQSFYEQVVNVPWIWAWPGRIPSGRRIETPVETLSLLPTLLAFCGLEVPAGLHAPALAEDLAAGREPAARPVCSEHDYGTRNYRTGDRLALVRDGTWKLTRFRDPRDKTRFDDDPQGSLYDLAGDPWEQVNRFGDPALQDVVRELTEKLDARDREIYGPPRSGSE